MKTNTVEALRVIQQTMQRDVANMPEELRTVLAQESYQIFTGFSTDRGVAKAGAIPLILALGAVVSDSELAISSAQKLAERGVDADGLFTGHKGIDIDTTETRTLQTIRSYVQRQRFHLVTNPDHTNAESNKVGDLNRWDQKLGLAINKRAIVERSQQ